MLIYRSGSLVVDPALFPAHRRQAARWRASAPALSVSRGQARLLRSGYCLGANRSSISTTADSSVVACTH